MPDESAQGPAGAFVPPALETLQAMLPQYEMLAIIGVGGMGAVYKARQKNLDRMVAIKVLPRDTGAEYSFAERFQREAQAMAKLHHQRIVSVHDFGQAGPAATGASEESDNLLYIVMEFVEGTDLHHLIKTNALDQNQVLAIITQICDALNYAHEKGVVHRDIKPANIMLDVEGNVKVADFGLAKLVDAKVQTQLTMTNMAMGTPDYIAPEQLETGAEVDHRADIYSLGVMIYEMLTGAVPRGAFQPPSQKATETLDPRLDDVVTRAMQADRETRYQQVTQLWTDVDRIRTTPAPAPGAAPKLVTGRIPVMGGETGRVQLVTGETGKVPPAQTTLPPAKPDNTKKIVLVSIGIAAALTAVIGLIYVISQPAPSNKGGKRSVVSEVSEVPEVPVPEPPPVTPPTTPDPDPKPEPVVAPTIEPPDPKIEAPKSNIVDSLPPLTFPGDLFGEIRNLEGHTNIIQEVAILPDNRRALSASWDMTVRLWDLQTGETIKSFESQNFAIALALSDDGKRALSSTANGGIHYFDLGKLQQSYRGDVEPGADGTGIHANSLAIAGNVYTTFVAGMNNGDIYFFTGSGREPARIYKNAHAGRIESLEFLPGGTHFISAAAGEDNPAAKLWSVDSDEPVRTLPMPRFNQPHKNGIGAIAVSPDGKILITAGAGGSQGHLNTWDIATGKKIASSAATKQGHGSAGVKTLRFLQVPGSTNRFALSSSMDKTLRIWDLATMTEAHRFETETHATNHFDVSPDGRFAVSGGGYNVITKLEPDGDNALRLWRLPEIDPDAIPYPLDLFTKIDISMNPLWKFENGELVSPREVNATGIVIPYELPDEYVLEAVLRADGHPSQLVFSLPFAGDRRAWAEFDKAGGAPNQSGAMLYKINSPEMPNGRLNNATGLITGGRTPHQILFRMRKDGVECTVDGNPVLSWSGDTSKFEADGSKYNGMDRFNKKQLQNRLGFWFYHPYTVEKLTLHPPDWTPPEPVLAKKGDAPPAPEPLPETEAGRKIAELTESFRKRYSEGPGAVFDAAVAKLNTSYAGALERESTKIAATGNLDAVLSFNTEIDAIKQLDGPAEPALSEVEGSLPELAENTPPALREMRQTYTDTVAKHAQKRDTDAAPILRDFDKALETLITDLTRAQKIEDALQVRKFRDQLKAENVSLFTGAAPVPLPGAWIPLFNGRDLDGWTVVNDAKSFTVVDGELVLVGSPAYLYYTGDVNGGEFTDFEFKAQVLTTGQANSGIYFHLPLSTNSSHPQKGYEIQIYNGDQRDKDRQTGSLYNVKDVSPSPVSDDEWFELHIRVEGKTITSTVNGKTMVEWTEPEDWNGGAAGPDRRLGSGTIAIQRNSSGSPSVRFKEIMIRPLD